MNNNLTGENHPNRVTCPRCGKPGTKQTRMIKRGNFNSGPYFYVFHRVGKKVKSCYIGKNWPSGVTVDEFYEVVVTILKQREKHT